MRIIYALDGQPGLCETSQEEDLREMAREIEEHLQAQHPALAEDDYLPIKIADGLLNSLADDGEEVDLGELGETP